MSVVDVDAVRAALESGKGSEVKRVLGLLRNVSKDYIAEIAGNTSLWPLIADWARQTRDAVLFFEESARL